jgi:IclR family acetate operon transcriptional repressor
MVEAVACALDILEAFGAGEELALKPLSERVGLGKGRTFRLLHTLVERGYLERTTDGKNYCLGVKLFERAGRVRQNIRDAALPHMRKLHGLLNETVNLGILDGADIVYVEMLESTHAFRMAAAIGTRSPVHACALGKAMAAFLPEQEASSILAAAPLRKSTAHTNTDTAEVVRELRRVREQGYAMDVEETEFGVACVGAPVLDSRRWPAAGISVSGPAPRILGRHAEIVRALVESAAKLSCALGYRGSSMGTRPARRYGIGVNR